MKKKIVITLFTLIILLVLGRIEYSYNRPEHKFESIITNAPNNKKEETKIIYILDSYVKNNKSYVVVDFIEWLDSDDWEKITEIEGVKRDKESASLFLTNDYYIYNEKKENIVIEVDKQAEILKLPEGGVPEPYKGSFGEFSIHHPHEIIIREGIITKIKQYYIP